MDGNTATHSLEELLAHANWVRSLARSLVRDPSTADDLVQETWVRALHAPPANTQGSPRSWLAAVLRNVWRERGRSERARASREERAAVAEGLSSSSEQLEELELQQDLAERVAELPEPYRSAIVWRYYEGLSSADISRRQGEPAARVRWRLGRARDLLREKLQRDHGERWTAHLALLLPGGELATPTSSSPMFDPASPAPASAPPGLWALATGLKGKALALAAVVVAAVIGFELLPGEPPPSPLGASPTALTSDSIADASSPTSGDSSSARAPILAPDALTSLGLAALPPAQPTASISGRVLAAEDGTPLHEVAVYLFDNENDITDRLETLSANDGAFSFEGIDPDDYKLALLLEGRVPRLVSPVIVAAADELHLEVEMQVGFEVPTLVLDSSTTDPVPGAQVLLIAGDRDSVSVATSDGTEYRTVSARTDGAGRAVVRGLQRGMYQIVVYADGFATHRGEASLRSTSDTLVLELERGGTLRGRVTTADGRSLDGAHVFLDPTVFERRLLPFFFKENGVPVSSDGSYEIHDIPAGDYYVVALCPDGSGAFHRRGSGPDEGALEKVRVHAAEETRLDLFLPAPGRVHGRVVDSTGEPISAASVSVSWGDFKPPGAGFFALSRVPGTKSSIHHTTKTDDTGSFEIDSLRSTYEPLEFRVTAKGFLGAEIELEPMPGEILEPIIELTPLGASIEGRLIDEIGEPVSATVGAWEYTGGRRGELFVASSEEDGSFALQVPARSSVFEVYPILRDHDAYSAEPQRRKGVPAGARDVDFVLHSRFVLEGTVVDQAGQPVRDFAVYLKIVAAPDGRPYDLQRRANMGEGRYRLPLDPELHVSALFTAPGFAPTVVGDLTGSGSSGSREVLMLDAPDLIGLVVDQDGNGIDGALICLATLDSSVHPLGSEHSPRARSDARGTFRLRGVPFATEGQLLVAPGRSDAPALVRVPLDGWAGDDLRIELPRSTTVEIEVVDPSGASLDGVVVVIDAAGWPLDARVDSSFQEFEDVRSSELGVLVDGQTRFALSPGDYSLLLIRDEHVTHAFALAVGDGDDEAPRRFVAEP